MAENNVTTRFPGVTFSSTGITGAPGQEIGRDHMLEWVSRYADRDSAIKFDTAITVAIDRDEEEHGNLHGIMDACKALESAAAA